MAVMAIGTLLVAPRALAEPRPYQPAVLRLSLTTLEGEETSVIDHTLIPAEGSPIGKRTNVNRTQFGKDLRNLYQQISGVAPVPYKNPSDPVRMMHRILIGPLVEDLKRLKITTLLISLDLELQSLPFAALHDGNQWFGSTYAYSVTPSLSLMPRVETKAKPSAKKKLLAGNTTFKTLSSLPFVEQELKQIAAITNSNIALNQDFNHKKLFEEAESEETHIIHIATHAEFIPGNPKESRVFLNNGFFTMNELRELRLSRRQQPLDLFTLSACRSAVGDSSNELGLGGLALLAGAQSAIGTLWYVDDVATSIFFIRFYKWLNEGVSKSEAMRIVRNEFINGSIKINNGNVEGPRGEMILKNLPRRHQRMLANGLQHPYFWAAPLLLGKPW